MSTWIAALIAVAAFTATYFSCVRPMMRGRGHCGMGRGSGQDIELDRQVAELKEELRVLRAADPLDGSQVSSGKPVRSADV